MARFVFLAVLMHWPETPVEEIADFTPRYCPNRRCLHHQSGPSGGFRFKRAGFYSTKRRRAVPRFRCLSCRRSFSRQTFATSYYLKRPELLEGIAAGLVAGSAHRQIARSLGCAHSTVTRRAARLGRHCLLLLARTLSHLEGKLSESVVFDHFETFEFTQDYPFGVAMAVGARSWFVYALEAAPHRRAGRKSAFQKKRLASRPERDFHGSYAGSCERLMETLLRLPAAGKPLLLTADGHRAYEAAARRPAFSGRVRLRSFPNPKRGPAGSPRSAEARRRDAAFFASDLLHRLLRHSQAGHRRETIAFGRRLNALMERFFVAAIWRNFVKARSERKPRGGTPAMRLNVADSQWSWRRVLGRRLFLHRETVPPAWRELYDRLWTTPLLTCNRRHDLIHAY